MAEDDDDFGGFEEAQPITIDRQINQLNASTESISSQTSTASKTSTDKPPDWLLRSIMPPPPQKSSIQPHQQPQNHSQTPQQHQNHDNELKKTHQLLIQEQEKNINMQKLHRAQIEQLQNANTQALSQLQIDMETNLRNSIMKQTQMLIESTQKSNLEAIQRLENQIKSNNAQLEERFEQKLAQTQEQLIKHYQLEYENIEVKLKKSLRNEIDDQLSEKLEKAVELIVKEQTTSNERFLKQYFQSEIDLFKEQLKSNTDQENLIIKDMVNSKLEKLMKTHELKIRNTNVLYKKQLHSLGTFLENAKKQVNLMQTHIEKQIECATNPNLVLADDEIEEPDDALLNMI